MNSPANQIQYPLKDYIIETEFLQLKKPLCKKSRHVASPSESLALNSKKP